ncbi:ATP-binding protein [Caballeronia humi]|uniref:Virulence sensor protein BvgS n=1 Tax=Caballeronia humi TaxID=326474 RepID=A0A158IKR8_9BURK|nr:transporter substrate-binding domain-containing protein [Caballeronia humi]SAL56829.1 sensor protein evgS [Caballeronia humi]
MSRFAFLSLRGARFAFCALFFAARCGLASAAQGGWVVGTVPGAVPPLDLSGQPAVAGPQGAANTPPVSGPQGASGMSPQSTSRTGVGYQAAAAMQSTVRGISADFAVEIAKSLGMALEWRIYSDRPSMLAALARGEIDTATTATGNDAGPPVILSRPYVPTKQVHVESRQKHATTGRIAYVEGQTSPERVRLAYPALRPTGFRNVAEALLAVSIGDADAFVGDYITTAYAIDHFALTSLAITGFAPFDEGGYSFAFASGRPDAAALREHVDHALAALPPRFLLEVHARWGATGTAVSFDEPLVFTDEERAWIAAHPVVHYSTLARAAPLAFRDANGRAAGSAADVLDAVARLTGLRFEARMHASTEEVDRDLRDGFAALTPLARGTVVPLAPGASATPGAHLTNVASAANATNATNTASGPSGFYTRPYGEGFFVVVTRAGAAPLHDAEALEHARIAVPAGLFVASMVQDRLPQAKIIETPTFDAQFAAVAKGRADAAVADMAFAGYAVANAYRGQLAITGAFSDEPVPYSFLVAAREPLLAGIMNRALDHLQPAELDAIRRRWSLGGHPETLWERRRPQIALGAALAFGVLLLLTGWAVSLRAQIARRVAAEAAMRASKEEAETANRAKSTFLATMSHEIRTPMNAVLGLLELELRSPGERAATERSLAIAHQAARDLLGLIDDILDVAKLEAERLVLAPAPLELDAWAAGVVAIYGPAARGKGVALVIEKSGAPGSVWVEADAQRLRQVAGNLLSNAIKFTAEGGVTLQYSAGDVVDGAREVLIAVSDTGIGMTAAQQAAIFAPFVQAHADPVGRYGGTGLGLTICRRLVTMMGGTIEVSSEAGRGSCFTVRMVLPVAPAVAPVAPEPALQPDAAGLAGLRALVVDDHPANRLVLGSQLTELGCAVRTANDGAEGLARWRAERADIDLILTDCQMPVMDGVEMTRAIRAAEAAGSDGPMPIIGVTADAQPEMAAQAVIAGMTACLVKPVGMEELRRALVLAVGARAVGVSALPTKSETDAQPQAERHAQWQSDAAQAARQSWTQPQSAAPTKPYLPPLAEPQCHESPQADYAPPFDHTLIDNYGPQAATLVEALQTANTHDFDDARDAFACCDYDRLRETAHRMKGAAFVIGATPFAQACVALQHACQSALDDDRNGEDDEQVAAAFREFIERGAALDAALSQRVM